MDALGRPVYTSAMLMLSPRHSSARGSWLLAGFTFVVTGLAALQVLCLWLSAARVPIGRPVAMAIALAAAVGGWSFAALVRARGPALVDAAGAAEAVTAGSAGTAGAQAKPAGAWDRALQALVLLQCAWGAVVVARVWKLAWSRPVYDWDGLYYHIPATQGWVQAGRVTWLPGMVDLPFANGYPMAIETLNFLVHRITGTSRLVDAGNLWYWPAGALGLAVIARLLGCTPWLALLAAAGITGAPAFLILSTTSYVDPAFACAVMALLACSLLVMREAGAGTRGARDAGAGSPGVVARRPSRSTALLWGLSAGLVLGAKGLGVLVVTVVLGVSAVLLLLGTAGRRRDAVGAIVIAGLAALAVGGYWYARNLVNTGNPIFPIQLKLFGVLLREGYDPRLMTQGDLPAELARWPRLLRMPVSWLQLDAPIREYGASGGLGWLWVAGGFPALVFLMARVRALGTANRRAPIANRRAPMLTAHQALVRLLLLVVALVVVQPAAWWSRFTLWLNGAGLPAVAAALEWTRVPRCPRAGRVLVMLLATAVFVVAAVEAEVALRAQDRLGRIVLPPPAAAEADDASGSASGRAPRYGDFVSSADRYFQGIDQAPGLRELFAARAIARGPWSRLGVLLGGVLALPLDARAIHPLVLPVDAAQLDRVQRAGVEWVVWDVLAAGQLPPALAERAAGSWEFHPAADVHFVAVRLGLPAQR